MNEHLSNNKALDEPDCIFKQADHRTILLNRPNPVKYCSNVIWYVFSSVLCILYIILKFLTKKIQKVYF